MFGAVLNAMQVDDTGRVAVVFLDHAMARAAGGTYEDTDGLVNLPLTVKEIQAVIFFKQSEGDEYRVSLRSKGNIDVGAVAKEFGGGGHKNAAGCTVRGNIDALRTTFVARSQAAVGLRWPGQLIQTETEWERVFPPALLHSPIRHSQFYGRRPGHRQACRPDLSRHRRAGAAGAWRTASWTHRNSRPGRKRSPGAGPRQGDSTVALSHAGDKCYEAIVQLGISTDTGDAEGAPVGARYAGTPPTREEIDAALGPFRGRFLQQPPVYSAKKIDGSRSYQLARAAARRSRRAPTGLPSPHRRGVQPAAARRPVPVEVTAHAVAILGLEGERLVLRVECSAGFYVRSLAHDLASGSVPAASRRSAPHQKRRLQTDGRHPIEVDEGEATGPPRPRAACVDAAAAGIRGPVTRRRPTRATRPRARARRIFCREGPSGNRPVRRGPRAEPTVGYGCSLQKASLSGWADR